MNSRTARTLAIALGAASLVVATTAVAQPAPSGPAPQPPPTPAPPAAVGTPPPAAPPQPGMPPQPGFAPQPGAPTPGGPPQPGFPPQPGGSPTWGAPSAPWGAPPMMPPSGAAPGALPMPPGFLETPGLWPRTIPYDEGVPAPPGYHLGLEPRRGMWIAGMTVFISTYGVALITGAAVAENEEESSALLAIPVAGPTAFALAVEDGNHGRPVLGVLSLVSLAQTAGLALWIAGFVAERDVYLRNDVVVAEREPETHFAAGPTGVMITREF